MLFKCKTCEELKRQNEYLRKLVDKLLISKGVQPIEAAETILDETEDEKADRALKEKGAIKYGD